MQKLRYRIELTQINEIQLKKYIENIYFKTKKLFIKKKKIFYKNGKFI